MDKTAKIELRLECLRLAVENGSARDFKEPHRLADTYYEWVTQGSGETRPEDSRKDGGPTKAKNSRNVRKGSEPQT